MPPNKPRDKKNPPAARQQQPPSPAEHFWMMVEWGGLLWAGFIAVLYVQQYGLDSRVFEGILPVQTFFPSLSAVLTDLQGVCLWLGLTALCWTVGRHALRPLRLPFDSALEGVLFELTAGFGCVSLAVLALAALHVLSRPLFYAVFAAGVGAAVLLVRREAPKLADAGRQAKSFLFGGGSPLFLRAFLWVFLALGLMMTFVPEKFYDALVYHLGVPNLFLQEGGIVRVPGVLSKVPMIWQTLWCFGLALQDEMIPKLLHWTTGLCVALGSGALAGRLGAPRIGMWGAVIFLSVPMVQMNLWSAGTDIGGALYAFMAVYALIAWMTPAPAQPGQAKLPEEPAANPEGWIPLSALLSSFAFGSKYQGGVVAVIAGALLLYGHFSGEDRSPARLAKRVLIFAGVAAAGAAPWLIKNLWDTGNPFFPFLSPLFDRLGWQKYHLDPDQWKYFIDENRRFITDSWTEFWKLPWLLTFRDRNESSLSFPGPVFLALLPIALLSFRKAGSRWFRALLLFLVPFFIFSFSSTHLTRYHLQGYPLLCVFFALGAAAAWERREFFFRAALGVVVGLLLLENLQTALFVVERSYLPWDVLSGRETRETYRMYTNPGLNPLPSNAMFRWMEQNLPRSTRTLFIGESKTFDLQRRYLYTDVHGQNPLVTWAKESSDADELYRKFQEAGITHLLLNFEEAHRTYSYKMLKWDPRSLDIFKRFWNEHVREVHMMMIPERYFGRRSPLVLYEVLPKEQAAGKPVPAPNPLVLLEEMNQPKPETPRKGTPSK